MSFTKNKKKSREIHEEEERMQNYSQDKRMKSTKIVESDNEQIKNDNNSLSLAEIFKSKKRFLFEKIENRHDSIKNKHIFN